MNVCIFYYDGFCEFEAVFTAALFKDHHVTAALENRAYISEERQKYLPETTLDQINPGDIDLFFIPGGDPASLFENSFLRDFILELNARGKLIAGICGGTFLMASCGILDGKKCTGDSSGLAGTKLPWFSKCQVCSDDIVEAGNTVTATGQAYLELAFTLARIMNLYPDKNKFDEVYRWYKIIK